MNDRELLELAAVAIGGSYWHYARTFSDYLVIEQAEPVKWNPLTDDGDALRLAVKLGLHKKLAHLLQGPAYRTDALSVGELAATRRAIVRAAADIGKDMVAQPSGKDLPEDDYYKTQSEAFYGDKP